MKHLPRRTLAALAISGMAASTALAQQVQSVSDQEIRDIARDAYIYAYPMLVTEMTRRVFTNVDKPEGTRAPDEPDRQRARIPRPVLHRCGAPQRRHALFGDVLRCVEGPDGVQRPRIPAGAITCCPCSTCGATCSCRPASAPPAPAHRPSP